MCYSVKTSIFSFSIGLISGIAALCTGQIILGVFILGYCQVQLAEALIWHGIDTSSISLNRAGTLYIKYTLPAHLLFIGIGVMLVNRQQYLPLLLGILFYVWILWYYSTNDSILNQDEPDITYPRNRGCMARDCQNNENRLIWPFKFHWYAIQLLLITIVTYFFMPLKNFLSLAVFSYGTLLVARFFNIKSQSTIWCFLAAILAPFIVFLNYLI